MKIIRNIFIVLAAVYACCIVYALIPQKSIPVQELAGKNSQFINVSGRMLHYEKYGTGKPVILVHGFAGSTYTWRKIIPLLSQHYRSMLLICRASVFLTNQPMAIIFCRSQAGADYRFYERAASLQQLRWQAIPWAASLPAWQQAGPAKNRQACYY